MYIMRTILKYKVSETSGEGFVATCIADSRISVFSKENGDELTQGIYDAAKLFANAEPSSDNEEIRKGNFEMKLAD